MSFQKSLTQLTIIKLYQLQLYTDNYNVTVYRVENFAGMQRVKNSKDFFFTCYVCVYPILSFFLCLEGNY